jgi:hypothetical protein
VKKKRPTKGINTFPENLLYRALDKGVVLLSRVAQERGSTLVRVRKTAKAAVGDSAAGVCQSSAGGRVVTRGAWLNAEGLFVFACSDSREINTLTSANCVF